MLGSSNAVISSEKRCKKSKVELASRMNFPPERVTYRGEAEDKPDSKTGWSLFSQEAQVLMSSSISLRDEVGIGTSHRVLSVGEIRVRLDAVVMRGIMVEIIVGVGGEERKVIEIVS